MSAPSPIPLWKLAAATGPYVKLAALSGAVAVILGAYGSHREFEDNEKTVWDLKNLHFSGQYPKETARESVKVFETASRYHFVHTLALLGLPLCRASSVVRNGSKRHIEQRRNFRYSQAGVFMVSGILMFCGPCYYFAFTSDKRFSKITPFGGTCFILGWLSMLY